MGLSRQGEQWPERRLIDRWSRLEHDLLERSTRRVHEFERRLELEWLALRQLHEEAFTTRRVRDHGIRVLVAVLAAFVIALAVLATYFYGRVADRLNVNEQAIREASELAKRENVRQAAESRKLSADRQRAALATERMLRVLAAHDVRRFPLYAPGRGQGAGHALWSPSQGLILEAARIPRPSSGRVQQVWLVTARRSISIGFLVPDASDRVSTSFETPRALPDNVVAIVVTEEDPASGHASPGNRVVLTTVEP